MPGGTPGRGSGGRACRLRGSHPVPPAFPCRSAARAFVTPARAAGRPGPRAHYPGRAARQRLFARPVWAGPLSLAATRGVSVDFPSCGYLDVSVPRVASARPMCSAGRYPPLGGWVPPFGHPGVEALVPLAPEYRRLTRPSSAPRAKASAVRPWYPAAARRARLEGRAPRSFRRPMPHTCFGRNESARCLLGQSIHQDILLASRYAALKVPGGKPSGAGCRELKGEGPAPGRPAGPAALTCCGALGSDSVRPSRAP